MNLNDDFSLRVADLAANSRFIPSPNPAVQRRMLDRVGDEVARATTIVRYVAGARFDRHVHGGGEEILVLDGVFSDEQGDHPAGTYLRNPPGSAHAPYSVGGCLLFVKLWQFAGGDLAPVRVDTNTAQWRQGAMDGVTVLPLHQHQAVATSLERWPPDTQLASRTYPGGAEIWVLSGEFSDQDGSYSAGSWLRNPCGSAHVPRTGSEGAVVYIKVGHLGTTFLQPSIKA